MNGHQKISTSHFPLAPRRKRADFVGVAGVGSIGRAVSGGVRLGASTADDRGDGSCQSGREIGVGGDGSRGRADCVSQRGRVWLLH